MIFSAECSPTIWLWRPVCDYKYVCRLIVCFFPNDTCNLKFGLDIISLGPEHTVKRLQFENAFLRPSNAIHGPVASVLWRPGEAISLNGFYGWKAQSGENGQSATGRTGCEYSPGIEWLVCPLVIMKQGYFAETNLGTIWICLWQHQRSNTFGSCINQREIIVVLAACCWFLLRTDMTFSVGDFRGSRMVVLGD